MNNWATQAPKTDIGQAQKYKTEHIANFQAKKEDSIRIQSAGRDAVLIATTFYANEKFESEAQKEEFIREKIKLWRSWMFQNIYNVPF